MRRGHTQPNPSDLGAFLYPCVERERLDDLLDLLLDELELLARTFGIEHAVTHRHRNPIHVLDLGDDLFGRAAESDVASLVGESAVTAALEVLRGELSGYFDCLGDRPARTRTVVGNAHLIAVRIAEPQPADVLHSIIRETE